jgi:hypothetical protein
MTAPPLPIPNSYWVIPSRLLAGEYPAAFGEERIRRRLDAFLEAGLDTFINLTGGNELPDYAPALRERAAYHDKKVAVLPFPIADFGLPSRQQMTALLDAIDQSLEAGRNIYLHCWGGIGRTGTVVGCFLVRRGLSGDQALAQIEAWWENDPRHAIHPRSPETDEQLDFVRAWHELA